MKLRLRIDPSSFLTVRSDNTLESPEHERGNPRFLDNPAQLVANIGDSVVFPCNTEKSESYGFSTETTKLSFLLYHEMCI